MAVRHGNDDVFHLLLSKGAKLEVKTSEGYPPLWYALKQDSRDLTQFGFAANLIAKGASPNTVRKPPLNLTMNIVINLQFKVDIFFYVTFTHTVKPVYNDQPRDQKSGRCSEVVVIYRFNWSNLYIYD